MDGRDVSGECFLTRGEVNEWVAFGAGPTDTIENPPSDSLCEQQWKNMSDDKTSKMWGVFDETGVFVSLCRHGFVLAVADMVKNGELYVYSP